VDNAIGTPSAVTVGSVAIGSFPSQSAFVTTGMEQTTTIPAVVGDSFFMYFNVITIWHFRHAVIHFGQNLLAFW
jgi:hypothetical protein